MGCDRKECDRCGAVLSAERVEVGSRGRILCLDCVMTNEPPSMVESRRLEALAKDLLQKPGWSGADLEFLERCADGAESDEDAGHMLDGMAEARAREEALRSA